MSSVKSLFVNPDYMWHCCPLSWVSLSEDERMLVINTVDKNVANLPLLFIWHLIFSIVVGWSVIRRTVLRRCLPTFSRLVIQPALYSAFIHIICLLVIESNEPLAVKVIRHRKKNNPCVSTNNKDVLLGFLAMGGSLKKTKSIVILTSH